MFADILVSWKGLHCSELLCGQCLPQFCGNSSHNRHTIAGKVQSCPRVPPKGPAPLCQIFPCRSLVYLLVRSCCFCEIEIFFLEKAIMLQLWIIGRLAHITPSSFHMLGGGRREWRNSSENRGLLLLWHGRNLKLHNFRRQMMVGLWQQVLPCRLADMAPVLVNVSGCSALLDSFSKWRWMKATTLKATVARTASASMAGMLPAVYTSSTTQSSRMIGTCKLSVCVLAQQEGVHHCGRVRGTGSYQFYNLQTKY